MMHIGIRPPVHPERRKAIEELLHWINFDCAVVGHHAGWAHGLVEYKYRFPNSQGMVWAQGIENHLRSLLS